MQHQIVAEEYLLYGILVNFFLKFHTVGHN